MLAFPSSHNNLPPLLNFEGHPDALDCKKELLSSPGIHSAGFPHARFEKQTIKSAFA
jgi:hypothetical protein